MKQKWLILKLLAGLITLLAMNWLIRLIFDPSFCYGNDTLKHKMMEFSGTHHQYNALFIGSSCFYWNLDPVLFDAIMPEEWNVSSYNFGSGGTLPPETYRFYHEILKRYGEGIKTVIIELRDIGHFPEHHRHTLRKRYYMNPVSYGFIIRASIRSGSTPKGRKDNVIRYGVSLIERMMNIDYFNDIYGQSEESRQESQERLDDLRLRGRQGFLSVLPDRQVTNRAAFLADTTLLQKRADAFSDYASGRKELKVNQAHLKQIFEIIRLCDKAGIHCVFLQHPRQDLVNIGETVALASHLPSEHLIDLTNPDLYPELYLVKNSLNNNHFNLQGTEILTTLAAEKFIEVHREWLKKQTSRQPM